MIVVGLVPYINDTCYKIAGHRPRECADCATRYKEKRAKESAEVC